MDIYEMFEKHSGEYLKFKRVITPLSPRPDLSAFLLLDSLLGYSDRDIISSAGYDEIFLSINIGELSKVVTEDDIVTLIRCGIRYSDEYDCLCMFV